MIVLTDKQNNDFLKLKESFKIDFESKCIDLVPVKIKDGSYILPEEILNDSRYGSILDFLINVTKREVNGSEFIKISI